MQWCCLETSALDNNEEEREGVATRCRELRKNKCNNFCFSYSIVRTSVPLVWRWIWWCDARIMDMLSRLSVLYTLLKRLEFIKFRLSVYVNHSLM